MELQLKNISETDMQQVSGLYYSAFPEDERAPWKALIQRGHGYGSGVLQLLKKRYPHTIMLCIEEVDEKYENYQQRIHRKSFYLRNGFLEMGFKYVEKGVKYEMLYVGEKLSSKVYDELMLYYCGNIYHKYRDNKDDEFFD